MDSVEENLITKIESVEKTLSEQTYEVDTKFSVLIDELLYTKTDIKKIQK